eukprot:TRINITY_DN29149_c0_g1_i1.p1 TRINITY_DN29149_c0_g1~~TRINITY_DN29149_c0_g1_i1.p1  ORF type:complete len:165 (+),score=32.39 TRINITY_DN29149_c0_g1_i1:120-614(+)
MCIRDRIQKHGNLTHMAGSGFSDVKNILSDIKLNLQSAESCHQNLVKHWCSDSPTSGSSAPRVPQQSRQHAVKRTNPTRSDATSSRLPTIPARLEISGSDKQASRQEDVQTGAMQQLVRSMPTAQLRELAEGLRGEIADLEASPSSEPTGSFTLVQSPAPAVLR